MDGNTFVSAETPCLWNHYKALQKDRDALLIDLAKLDEILSQAPAEVKEQIDFSTIVTPIRARAHFISVHKKSLGAMFV